MHSDRRLTAYFAQTGRSKLTPAQRRRARRKTNRQKPEAAERREARTAAKLAARGQRKQTMTAGLAAA